MSGSLPIFEVSPANQSELLIVIKIHYNGLIMITSEYTTVDINESEDLIVALRKLHTKVPLTGNTPNDLLSIPDAMLWYLIAGIRNTPVIPEEFSIQEWNNWISLLKPHRIIPLLAYHINSWPDECRPPLEIYNQFVEEFHSALVRTMLTDRQLQSMLNALAEVEIPIILLKGQSLARSIYPDPALRQSSDIDLLVLPEHMKQLEAILENLGYSTPAYTFDISPFFYQEQIFISPKKGLPVEGHWALDCNFDIFQREWLLHAFRDRISIQEPNFRFDTLSFSNHLVYLAFHHIFQHDAISLSWIMDIAYLMKYLSLQEYQKICSDSVKNNIRVPMEYALIAGSLWSGCPIHPGYSDFSQWPHPSIKEQKIRRYAKSHGIYLLYFVHIMVALSDRREKIRYLYWFILPPTGLLMEYRRSESFFDIPCAHVRRWASFTRHLN